MESPAHIAWLEDKARLEVRHAAALATHEAWVQQSDRVKEALAGAKAAAEGCKQELKDHLAAEPPAELEEPE